MRRPRDLADRRRRGAPGQRLAAALLDELTARHPLTTVETTITPGNAASLALFAAYAARHRADVEQTVFFDDGLFPGDWRPPEVLPT
ncbi:hypothetical protein AB0B69_32190 [Micromonospora parva]|uniref:hypothetical protein n=1 Tax=Micromonospora parva TaxID=1464048 RepID=UPI0033CD3D83